MATLNLENTSIDIDVIRDNTRRFVYLPEPINWANARAFMRQNDADVRIALGSAHYITVSFYNVEAK